MGKKRKTDHGFAVVVEESREPAAYTVGKPQQHQQQEQQQQEQEQHVKEEEQQAYQQEGGEYGGGGYEDDDRPPGRPHVYPGGSRIDPDTLSYLTEVCETLSGMSDPEEAELLRSNVLEEIQGKELQLASDAASSTLMEQLLSGAPASQLMQFLGAFTDGEMLWRLASAAFGSHVSEKVLAWLHAAAQSAAEAPAAAADGSSDPAAADIEGLETLLDSLVTALEPHIVDYATDKHATHVARALLVVVAGKDVLTPPGKKQRQRQKEQQQYGGGEGEEGQGAGQQQQHTQHQKNVFGPQRSSLAEKMQGTPASGVTLARFPVLLRRLVKALPLFDPQQMSALGKNTYGGPLLQATLRAAALDEALLMLMLPPILGLDPSKAAAAAPGQRLATLTDSHVGRLLRDDCYSHLLEVAVAVMPQAATAPQAVAVKEEEGTAEEGGDQKKRKKRKAEAGSEDEEEETAAAAAAAAAGAGKGTSLADEFFERFLKGRLLPLCCHHCANFVIQAVLSATHNRNRVAAYVTELSPHLADLLRRRRSGVVAALAAAAARGGPGPHQQAFVTALATALGQLAQWQGRTGTSHLAPALVTLDTNATLGAAAGSSGSTTRLSTPGTAMLALLLGQFPAAVVAPFWESMGVLPQSDLLRIGKDPAGSRLLEVALTVAPTEGGSLSKRQLRKLKKKQKTEGDASAAADGSSGDAAAAARAAMLASLKGCWGTIVQAPAGSFLAEAVFNTMSPEEAEGLVAEVAAAHEQLMSRCSWGTFLSKKLGLEVYLRSSEEWRKRTAAAATARKEFQQLLATTGKHGKPIADSAAAAAAGRSAAGGSSAAADQQQQQPAGAAGAAPVSKKKRRREEAAAAAGGAAGAAAVADAAAAGEVDASDSNAKKRARLAAAAIAAAEAAAGEAAEGEGSKKDRKQKRKRESAAAEAADAAGEDEPASLEDKPPKKKSKKAKHAAAGSAEGDSGAAVAAVNGKRGKNKRARHSAENSVPSKAGAGDVDVLALLGFGGLSVDKHSSKKQKK